MPTTDLTAAFAGHAPNARQNIRSLVSDFLHLGSPDREGYYETPDRWGKLAFYVLALEDDLPAALKTCLDLALSIDGSTVYIVTGTTTVAAIDDAYGEYVDKILAYDDPMAELIDILSDQPRPHLLINWDPADADDEHLIALAHQQSHITVSDLVMGRTEILPNNSEDPEEPEPEKEERPSRRRARRKEPEELEEEPEELEETPSTLEEEVSAAHRATGATQSTIATGDITVPADQLRDVLGALDTATYYMQAVDNANATKNLADQVVYSPLTQQLETQSQSLYQLLNPLEPYEKSLQKTTQEQPKKKPSGKGTRVIWDEDAQEWKKAGRGRPRAGARTGLMDDDGNVTES